MAVENGGRVGLKREFGRNHHILHKHPYPNLNHIPRYRLINRILNRQTWRQRAIATIVTALFDQARCAACRNRVGEETHDCKRKADNEHEGDVSKIWSTKEHEGRDIRIFSLEILCALCALCG